jgi:hypothetical protein
MHTRGILPGVFCGPLAQLVEQLTLNPLSRTLHDSASKRRKTKIGNIHAGSVRFIPRSAAHGGEAKRKSNWHQNWHPRYGAK